MNACDALQMLPNGAEDIPDLSPSSRLGPVYFDPNLGCYWIENSRGDWIKNNTSDLIRRLKAAGFARTLEPGATVSQLDQQIIQIQDEQDVAYAGSLAGYRKGVADVCGRRVLVTDEPKLIEPRRQAWPTIRKLLKNLLKSGDCDQQPQFFGWVKVAVNSIRSGIWQPGQSLVIAGERECGKSLLQSIITAVLGGRVAKPYRYMSGETDFNGELFGAEHLAIEDELSSRYINTRRAFGARIKEFTVNEVQSHHSKNRQAISLTPRWRLSISVNDEPENLLILPPIDESMRDKLMLLKAFKKPMPMPTSTGAERKAFWDRIESELPGYLHFLDNWKIPNHFRCERFGIKTYQHPELLITIDELSPEFRLLELLKSPITANSTKDIGKPAKPVGSPRVYSVPRSN
jgi:hypothetical protein